MVMAQRSITIHRENRTPWQDVTSICDRTEGEVSSHESSCCVVFMEAWRCSSHLALEAEDGDGQTHQSRDSQTQQHRFGVVEAVGSTNACVQRVGCLKKAVSPTDRCTSVHLRHRLYLPWHESHHEGHAQSLSDEKPKKTQYNKENQFGICWMKRCVLIWRTVFHAAEYSQKQLTEKHSRETASCSGRKRDLNQYFQQWNQHPLYAKRVYLKSPQQDRAM